MASISKRMRMPYLEEVVERRTRPPLDLYCFFTYLHGLGNGEHDILEFYLDVRQHESLCRAYFKDLRRLNIPIEQEWPDFYHWARQHGTIYADVSGIHEDRDIHSPSYGRGHEHGHSHYPTKKERTDAERIREEYTSEGERDRGLGDGAIWGGGRDRGRRDTESHGPTSPSAVYGHSSAVRTRSPSKQNANAYASGSNLRSNTRDDEDRNLIGSRTSSFGRDATGSGNGIGGKRFSKGQPPAIIGRNEVLTQNHLFTSAEKIYTRYLMDNAEQPIYLDPSLRIHDFPHPPTSKHTCDPRIPDYFNSQREYIFKQLEQQYYPIFLREKGFGNLTRAGVFASLFAGLFALWAGLVVAFTLVFYDYKPKIRRLGLIVPWFFAFYFLFSAYYAIAPHLVLFRRTEIQFLKTIRTREPYIQKIHAGRAAIMMVLVVVATAVMTVIWWAVPGHRL